MNIKEYLKRNKQLTRFSFGEFMKLRRNELGISIRDVSHELGVTPAYIRDIEQGNRHAPVKMLKELELVLKIDAEDHNDFEDLAYLSHETCAPDLIQYLIENEHVRKRLRKKMHSNNASVKINRDNTFNPEKLVFVEYMRKRREELGISLRCLAKEIGVSAAYLCDVEMGKKHAPVKYLSILENVLEIPEHHKRDFEDLAYLDYGNNAQYITDFMLESREARLAVRYLIEKNISGEKLLEIVENQEENLNL